MIVRSRLINVTIIQWNSVAQEELYMHLKCCFVNGVESANIYTDMNLAAFPGRV